MRPVSAGMAVMRSFGARLTGTVSPLVVRAGNAPAALLARLPAAREGATRLARGVAGRVTPEAIGATFANAATHLRPARRRSRDRITFQAPRTVLPAPLRRPVRLLSRIDVAVPRHAGAKLALALLAGAGLYGMASGGHTEAVVGAVTIGAGLGIESVTITGQSQTSEVDLLDRLAIGANTSLVTFDAEAARRRIETLPWIAEATVRKFYPDTLKVEVSERTPFALWQRDGTVVLVDDRGEVISDFVDLDYAGLPLVVGAGAGTGAKDYAALVEAAPSLRGRVKAATLVGERRWNIVLTNGVTIMLPQDGAEAALRRVADIDAANGLLSRDIATVDLRLADRLVVRLTEEGAARLKAAMKEREKLMRQRGANA